jgi:hypothetical protein
MRSVVTKADMLKLDRVSNRLRDIFDRDKTSPIVPGATHYTIRALIEALGIERLFYESASSPFENTNPDGSTERPHA